MPMGNDSKFDLAMTPTNELIDELASRYKDFIVAGHNIVGDRHIYKEKFTGDYMELLGMVSCLERYIQDQYLENRGEPEPWEII